MICIENFDKLNILKPLWIQDLVAFVTQPYQIKVEAEIEAEAAEFKKRTQTGRDQANGSQCV